MEVLFEEFDRGVYKGHTANYIMVKIKTEENLENKIKEVEIVGKENLTLIAK